MLSVQWLEDEKAKLDDPSTEEEKKATLEKSVLDTKDNIQIAKQQIVQTAAAIASTLALMHQGNCHDNGHGAWYLVTQSQE